MLATHNSRRPSPTPLTTSHARLPLLWAPLSLALACLASTTTAPPPDASPHLAYARRVYHQAQRQYQQAPDNPTNSWLFARACFDLAEMAQSNTQRTTLAQQGIDACRLTLSSHPSFAPAHYYLGMNLGQLARTKNLSALPIITEMREAFQAAIRLDPGVHYAGPHRTLGVLYRDAPGWPASIGSRTKAKHHLEQALRLNPDFPANHLAYLESLLEWGENELARKKLPAAQAALQAARSKFTGDPWAFSWEEWDQGWKTIQAKLKPQTE